MPYSIQRYHDFSAGHRVSGHETKCQHLHGHNYRVHFTVVPVFSNLPLDNLGRVIDFGVVGRLLGQWLENNWDHKMLIWEKDPLREKIYNADPNGIVFVPFNPTAENLAKYLVQVVGPIELDPYAVALHSVTIDETRKCSATFTRDEPNWPGDV